MLARALSYGLAGTEGFPVAVEAFVTGGLPMLTIVGLPDAAVKESRDRVSAALQNSGYTMPVARITVNLAPADLKKEGPAYDLPIAVAVLAASRQIVPHGLSDTLLLGEVSLDGTLTPVRGALPMVISARERGVTRVVLPEGNAQEAACVDGMQVFPAMNLRRACEHLTGASPIAPAPAVRYETLLSQAPEGDDLRFVRGQKGARRALEVAAAGGHNLLMVGVPGSGKTMLARCLPGILPPMTFDEAMETTRIHSVAGTLGGGLMTRRPFRAPHHSASLPALVGGGANARPGEISLAHNGVLFLDELPEYQRGVLEAMRQPLEDGRVSIARARAQVTYPARCMLVASMNPCPCGYYGSKTRHCRCGSHEIRKYLDRISGPLLDRIDLQVEVDAVPVSEIALSGAEEDSAAVRARVQAARARQIARFAGEGIFCNAQMNAEQLRRFAAPGEQAQALLNAAVERMGLSMRGYARVLKVARTLADLRGEADIGAQDIAEAIQYRTLDEKYWS